MLPQFMIYKIQEPYTMKIEQVGFHKSHWHDNAFEFVLVLKGSIHASIGCEKYIMNENDLLIISPEDVHSFSKIEEENIVLFFQINCEYFQNVFPNIMQWILFTSPTTRISEDYQHKALRYYLAKLFYSLPDANNPLVEIIPFLSFCEKNFQTTHMIIKKDDVTEKQMELFYEIDDYVYNHFTEQIELSDISNFLNYNKFYFSNLVKTITGMNFLEYLNHVRVLAAERFLISTDKKISDIAFECGFSDIRSLNRYFKKWYECTPNEYRKLNHQSSLEEEHPVVYTLESHQVKEKLDAYISKLEKIKEINLKLDKTISNWEMPALIFLNEVSESSIDQKQWMLQEVIRECSFRSVLFDEACENDIKSSRVPNIMKDCLENKINNVYLLGENGVFTNNGIKKPIYFAFYLLSKISKQLTHLEDGFAVGQNDSGIQILLYNSSLAFSENYLAFKIMLNQIKHDYKVKKYYLDEENGNAFSYIKKLGNPSYLSLEDEELIKKITFPKVIFDEIKNHDHITFFENLPFQGAILITLEKI